MQLKMYTIHSMTALLENICEINQVCVCMCVRACVCVTALSSKYKLKIA